MVSRHIARHSAGARRLGGDGAERGSAGAGGLDDDDDLANSPWTWPDPSAWLCSSGRRRAGALGSCRRRCPALRMELLCGRRCPAPRRGLWGELPDMARRRLCSSGRRRDDSLGSCRRRCPALRMELSCRRRCPAPRRNLWGELPDLTRRRGALPTRGLSGHVMVPPAVLLARTAPAARSRTQRRPRGQRVSGHPRRGRSLRRRRWPSGELRNVQRSWPQVCSDERLLAPGELHEEDPFALAVSVRPRPARGIEAGSRSRDFLGHPADGRGAPTRRVKELSCCVGSDPI